MRGWVLYCVAAVSLWTTESSAQQRVSGALKPGVHIRYSEHAERSVKHTGRLERVDDGELRIVSDADSTVRVLPFESISDLAVSDGRRSAGDGAAHGALKGLAVGAVLSAVFIGAVALSNADERCSDCMFSATGSAVVLSVIGTFAITGLGALIGMNTASEEWIPVPVPHAGGSGRNGSAAGARRGAGANPGA
jgi:hypothetical protein